MGRPGFASQVPNVPQQKRTQSHVTFDGCPMVLGDSIRESWCWWKARASQWAFWDGVGGKEETGYRVIQNASGGPTFGRECSLSPEGVWTESGVSRFLRVVKSRLSERWHNMAFFFFFKRLALNVKLEDLVLSSVSWGYALQPLSLFPYIKNEKSKYVPYLAGWVAVWLRWCSQLVYCNVLYKYRIF